MLKTTPFSDHPQVTAPTALYAGNKNQLADLIDVKILAERLPNLLELNVITADLGWEHADFFASMRADTAVFHKLRDLMNILL